LSQRNEKITNCHRGNAGRRRRRVELSHRARETDTWHHRDDQLPSVDDQFPTVNDQFPTVNDQPSHHHPFTDHDEGTIPSLDHHDWRYDHDDDQNNDDDSCSDHRHDRPRHDRTQRHGSGGQLQLRRSLGDGDGGGNQDHQGRNWHFE
jgi:hypothetical protein